MDCTHSWKMCYSRQGFFVRWLVFWQGIDLGAQGGFVSQNCPHLSHSAPGKVPTSNEPSCKFLKEVI